MSSYRLEIAGALAATFVLETTISLIGACVPVLAPVISVERGWNVGLIALYAPIVSVASLIITFEVPRLLDRLGGMGLMLLCVIVSVGGLLCLLLSHVGFAGAAAIAIGFATGARNPASSQILGARASPRTMGLILSIKQTGVPLGAALAGVLVPILVLQSGAQMAVIELALIGSACAGLLVPAIGRVNTGGVPSMGRYRPLAPVKTLLAMPGMLTFLCAAMSFVSMQICLRSFFTIYLVHIGFDLTAAGMAFGISQAAGIVGQVGWAVLSDRLLSARWVMVIIGLCMSAGAALTAAIMPDWPIAAIIPVALLYGVSAAGCVPVVLAEVARRSPPLKVGALTSGANLFLLGGFLVGPLLFGVVLSRLNYEAAFLALATCTLGASVMVAPGRRSRRHGLEGVVRSAATPAERP